MVLGDDFIEFTEDIEGNFVRSRLSWDFLDLEETIVIAVLWNGGSAVPHLP